MHSTEDPRSGVELFPLRIQPPACHEHEPSPQICLRWGKLRCWWWEIFVSPQKEKKSQRSYHPPQIWRLEARDAERREEQFCSGACEWGWLQHLRLIGTCEVDWNPQALPTDKEAPRPRGILGTDDKKAWTPGLNVLGTVMCAPVLNHLRREQNAPGTHNVIHPGCGGAVHYFWMLRRILPVSQNTNHSSWGDRSVKWALRCLPRYTWL